MRRGFSFDNDDELKDCIYGLVKLRWPFEVLVDHEDERLTLLYADPHQETHGTGEETSHSTIATPEVRTDAQV